ncbi:MAG: NAD(P)/FAD-dependent oxidoreductase, partial [Nitrososphaerales archaeon]
QLVLGPEIARTMAEMDPAITQGQAAQHISDNLLGIMISSIVTHLVFGVTLGLLSSTLSIKFGSRYRCSRCDISFARIDSHRKHMELVHGAEPIQLKRILILGGGFAGVEVLRQVQDAFQDDVSVEITLVSRDNFFLFTPMLPEVSSGMIETRHIVTPVRAFCKRAKFYEADVESLDLQNKKVVITHAVGRQSDPVGFRSHELKYDYLVLALGSETNFFGMDDIERNAFTIKSLGDAVVLRNHVINMLEQADLEHENPELRSKLLTFVVVGGGFAGVETVGELNDFIHDSIKNYYHNLDEQKNAARIMLVNAGARLLPEVSEDLAEFALERLGKSGVEVLLKTRVEGTSTADSVKLSDGTVIPSHTLVWAGGVTPDRLVASLPCEHDKGGRVVADGHLEVRGRPGVFALGDCASIIDPGTGRSYPPTAQHARRQGRIVARNIIALIRGGSKAAFDYRTRGMMAKIGRRDGVGILMGHKVQGFAAWWIWRSYYLMNLPTVEKKLRVMVDWSIDLLFKRDVTRLKTFREGRAHRASVREAEILQ